MTPTDPQAPAADEAPAAHAPRRQRGIQSIEVGMRVLDALTQQARPLPLKQLAQLADMAAMSERTFVRRFRDVAGMPPGQYLQKMRLDIAKHLLEETDQPLEWIVGQVGYSDVSSFRRLFKKEVSVSPGVFRERFR